MPRNAQYTHWAFKRDVLAGSTGLTTIGPLKLHLPTELWRRRLYVGVLWQGFTDWVAEGELTLWDNAAPVVTMRQRWGTTFGSSGASSTGWGGSAQNWRATTPGFPHSAIDIFDPAVVTNWPPVAGCPDALTLYGVQQPDGATSEAARITLFPWEFIGPLDEVRFEFKAYTATTTTATPTVEVFLGCKSFKE